MNRVIVDLPWTVAADAYSEPVPQAHTKTA